jgi:predicted enzyme related to lactoylglutathione lyase
MANREIVHIEIPARGRADLAKFYAELFGWETTAMDDAKYTLWKSGNIAGGFPDVDETYKPGDVIVYIDSDDIEADLKQIESKGGKTLQGQTEIPGFGWYALFADPTGNRIALYKGGNKS